MQPPVIRRYWRSTGTRVPYRSIHDLKPGEHWWNEEPLPSKFTQHYVLISGLGSGSTDLESRPVVYEDDIAQSIEYIPAEAAIARELSEKGATWSVWTDIFCGRRAFVLPNLRCINPEGSLRDILEQLRLATGRKMLGGLPDVIAGFADGLIAMREAKHVSKRYRDRWGPKQESLAMAAHALWPGKVDIAVVEWGTDNLSLTETSFCR